MILDMLGGIATEILMTAALLLVITVRLLNKEKTKVQNYTKKRNRQNNSINNGKKEENQSIFREHINS